MTGPFVKNLLDSSITICLKTMLKFAHTIKMFEVY